MNHALRGSHCRAPFVPHPRVKAQRCCSHQPCQRARKAQWQRDKLARDPAYRANQRDCQRHWQRHPPPLLASGPTKASRLLRAQSAQATTAGPPTPRGAACKDGRIGTAHHPSIRHLSPRSRGWGTACKDGRVIAKISHYSRH
jgi:hypothetical protein